MYGDTAVMRKRSGQLREQSTDIKMLADQLVARAEAVDWTGRAADAMRARIRERATQLRDAASSHDTAADSLVRHLTEVDTVKEAISGIEHRASSLVADAGTRVAQLEGHHDRDGSRRTPTEVDQTLTSSVPPEPGHQDWLTVHLPGL